MDISSGAQTDWNEADPTSPAFLKNKPTIASHAKDGLMSKEDKKKLDDIDLTDLVYCSEISDCIYANRDDVIEALGYEEIEIAMKDTTGRLVSRTILAKIDDASM